MKPTSSDYYYCEYLIYAHMQQHNEMAYECNTHFKGSCIICVMVYMYLWHLWHSMSLQTMKIPFVLNDHT